MNIFIYAILFIIGTFFGSFFTLAVYRIPKKEDILIKHSYCPNCNHKLGFFDLFPVLSYIFLGGKCRYCKTKIRPRYLILELLAGVTFLILALAVGINIFSIRSIVNLGFLLIYIATLFIIAGIDKENVKIDKNVLIFGYIIQILYMIYQCTLGKFNVYQYVIYFIIFLILLITSKIFINISKKEEYLIHNIYLSLYMAIYIGFKNYIITAILSLIFILIYKILCKNKEKETAIGFYLCISNIITIIILNFILNYIV